MQIRQDVYIVHTLATVLTLHHTTGTPDKYVTVRLVAHNATSALLTHQQIRG